MDFKQIRIQQSVKQKEIVKRLKISTGCFSQWENGKRMPRIDQLPRLAQVLNCSIEEVVKALIETKEQRNEQK